MNGSQQLVLNIFSNIFKISVDSISDDFSMHSSAEWDSMKQLTIITAIENEFDIFIDASDAAELTSIMKIVEFLDNHPELV